ncbi:hypothetical protein T01_12109 [Trichinella spiralis]|uniref:Uncharacterized protein n=1 Tax=Trichinella spiralis TaxID=6334 RepID=A0A0V0Z1S7_TRISP|nr:hypothetical protein T01_12109 [Trichinella spiralis]
MKIFDLNLFYLGYPIISRFVYHNFDAWLCRWLNYPT